MAGYIRRLRKLRQGLWGRRRGFCVAFVPFKKPFFMFNLPIPSYPYPSFLYPSWAGVVDCVGSTTLAGVPRRQSPDPAPRPRPPPPPPAPRPLSYPCSL